MGICSSNKIPKRLLTQSTFNKSNIKEKYDDLTTFRNSHNKNLIISSLIGLNDFNESNLKYQKGSFIYNKQVEYQIDKKNIDEDLLEKVELFISLSNIQNISSNYSIKIYLNNNLKYEQYQFLNQTEECYGSKIDFSTTFIFNYFFEKEQGIRYEILQEKNIVSTMEIYVSSFMSNKDFRISKKIIDDSNKQYLGIIQLDLKVLPKKNKLRGLISEFSIIKFEYTQSDNDERFFIFKNFNDGEIWRPSYKSSEFFLNNKNFTFKNIKLQTHILCESENQNILIEIYKTKDNFPSGYAVFSLNNLMNQILIYENIKSEKILGQIIINHKYHSKKRFTDYLKEGIDMNLNIAIDYTISNGKPNNKDSLHYADGDEPNDYEKAIYSCGKIVAYYDKDQIFPVYGFGGIPPGEEVSNNCFNINFTNSPNIETIEEVITIYKNSLKYITFKGPTYFAPVISKVMEEIKKKTNEFPEDNHYEILMILTDGIINDMEKTLELLVDCAELPLSIIIIGIGNANFKDMHKLDGDEIPLTDFKGRVTKRDLVQFVEYEKFKKKNVNEELSEEVLREIPRQVEEYYALTNNFHPK